MRTLDLEPLDATFGAVVRGVKLASIDEPTWQALHAARAQDSNGNSVTGPHDLVDCRNVLVDSDGPRVSVIGLEGVIVVVDGNDILVTTAEGAQKVGKLPGAVNQ